MKIIFSCCILLLSFAGKAQNVGIGTTTPNPKSILEINATDKGVLFPRLSSAQRNAIANPPDGLHIYNKDERCLNYYDSVIRVWNCYCETDTCKSLVIRISANANNIDFNAVYATKYPLQRKFVILVEPGVIISDGINFINLPLNTVYQIKIANYGGIYGRGGNGGAGSSGQSGSCAIAAGNGGSGTNAIATRWDVKITIDNFGVIAGGGGGGGGGGRTAAGQYGGGGGGGAGSFVGTGGTGGGQTISITGCFTSAPLAQNGGPGTTAAGGAGGNGNSGGSNGGPGGGLAQVGQIGAGTSGGAGGQPGKAIASFGGASNSIINNLGGGQSFGVIE
jgi:hypothetical protein